MAKTPPATVDRFRIHAETSKEHMGHVLAELTKMGLANIGYELVTDVMTFRSKNGPRKVHAGVKALPAPKGKRPTHVGPRQEISNKDVLLKRIKGRAKFTVGELQDHFTNIKRNPKSVSPITSKLAQAKIITLIELGTYAWGKKKIAKKKQVRKKRDAPVASPSLEKTNG